MKPRAHRSRPSRAAHPESLDLRAQSLVICLGPGGVGKTTISAALAVRAAMLGRAVDVMTVDPAPRLLDALGLGADSSEPVEVPLDGIRHARRGGGVRSREAARVAAGSEAHLRFDRRALRAVGRGARHDSRKSNLSQSLGRAGGRGGLHGDGKAARTGSQSLNRPAGARHSSRGRGDRLSRRAAPPARTAQLARRQSARRARADCSGASCGWWILRRAPCSRRSIA